MRGRKGLPPTTTKLPRKNLAGKQSDLGSTPPSPSQPSAHFHFPLPRCGRYSTIRYNPQRTVTHDSEKEKKGVLKKESRNR